MVGGGSRAARSRGEGLEGGRRLHHADPGDWQHERALHHDRGEGGSHDLDGEVRRKMKTFKPNFYLKRR